MLIAAERERQIAVEGYTATHDDVHMNEEMVLAAECYLHYGANYFPPGHAPTLWPWRSEDWKPSVDPTANLIKAGALIAAEIDRVARRDRTS